MGLYRLRDLAFSLLRHDRLLSQAGSTSQGPLRRAADFWYDRHRVLACRYQRRHGRRCDAGRRRSSADGELWRLRSCVHDVRHRRHHEREHAAVCVLIAAITSTFLTSAKFSATIPASQTTTMETEFFT